eukprot:365847-Chlamydomonas_euryale.AAC.22
MAHSGQVIALAPWSFNTYKWRPNDTFMKLHSVREAVCTRTISPLNKDSRMCAHHQRSWSFAGVTCEHVQQVSVLSPFSDKVVKSQVQTLLQSV